MVRFVGPGKMYITVPGNILVEEDIFSEAGKRPSLLSCPDADFFAIVHYFACASSDGKKACRGQAGDLSCDPPVPLGMV
jgi:hypothetical protein